MRLPPHVRCLYGPTDSRWYGIRFDDRHIAKRLPHAARSWNGLIRAWVTPHHVLADLAGQLEEAGYTVTVVDVSRTPERRDWHAAYQDAVGQPCPHHQDTTAAHEAAHAPQMRLRSSPAAHAVQDADEALRARRAPP